MLLTSKFPYFEVRKLRIPFTLVYSGFLSFSFGFTNCSMQNVLKNRSALSEMYLFSYCHISGFFVIVYFRILWGFPLHYFRVWNSMKLLANFAEITNHWAERIIFAESRMLGGRLPGGVRCLQRSHLALDHAGIRTMATAPDTVRIVEVRIA